MHLLPEHEHFSLRRRKERLMTRTERADTGTASMRGKATEKNQMAARLTSGCGAPFWRISAAHGWKRGSAVDKEKPISKRSSTVSHHRSGGQVQALAL